VPDVLTGTFGIFPSFHGIESPDRSLKPGRAMEIVYFIGAFILLVVLIYGTLSWRYRDRRKDQVAEQIVRERYHNNET
jgi:hypothetical protein